MPAVLTPVAAALSRRVPGRDATWGDVEQLCASLNELGCDYVLHGGFPLSIWLGTDYTGDVDLCVRNDLPNYEKLREALGRLPEHKTLRYTAKQLLDNPIVRVIDDIVVDVIQNISAIHFDDLEVLPVTHGSITIPMVSGDCLYRIKQFAARRSTEESRPKHALDLARLARAGYTGGYTRRIVPLSFRA